MLSLHQILVFHEWNETCFPPEKLVVPREALVTGFKPSKARVRVEWSFSCQIRRFFFTWITFTTPVFATLPGTFFLPRFNRICCAVEWQIGITKGAESVAVVVVGEGTSLEARWQVERGDERKARAATVHCASRVISHNLRVSGVRWIKWVTD